MEIRITSKYPTESLQRFVFKMLVLLIYRSVPFHDTSIMLFLLNFVILISLWIIIMEQLQILQHVLYKLFYKYSDANSE